MASRMRFSIGIWTFFALLLVTNGLDGGKGLRACDFCVRDRAGAVYSFKNRRIASQAKATSVSVKINGINSDEKLLQLEKKLRSIPGILPETVLISAENLTASFVFTAATSFEQIALQVAKENLAVTLERIPEISDAT